MTSDRTTVYSITAGYVPTLGFNLNDFALQKKSGKKRDVGYDGTLLNYNNAIGPDGELKTVRMRGSIAWYEYSTTVKAIKNELLKEKGMQDQLKKMAKQWYGTTGQRDVEDRRLLQELTPQISEEWVPRTSDEYSSGEVGRGTKGTQEEQIGSEGRYGGRGYHPDEKGMRDEQRLSGRANAIDVYMRGIDGNIYRMDVTAMTVQEGGHHGLGAAFAAEGSAEESEMVRQIESGEFDTLEANLLKYFQNTQTKNWNPVIKNIVNHVETSKSEVAGRFISDLKDGISDLSQNSQALRDTLIELRGGSAGNITGQLTGGDTRSIVQAVKGGKSQANRMTEGAAIRMAMKIGPKAYDSAITFALHMFGNIMEIFRSNSARQGGYSTGYGLGRGVAANYTVEVQHQIHSSGAQVFQFMDLKQGDVILHHFASLSEAYKRDIWWRGKSDVNALAVAEGRKLNLNWMANQIGGDMVSVEVDSVVTSAYQDTQPKVIMAGASVIAPERVNADIDDFITKLEAPSTAAHSLLKPHVKNLSDLFDLGEEGSVAGAWNERVDKEHALNDDYIQNRQNYGQSGWNPSFLKEGSGYDEMMMGQGDTATQRLWKGKGHESFKAYHKAKIAPASAYQNTAVGRAIYAYGKRSMGKKNNPLTNTGGLGGATFDAMESGWSSQSAYSFNLMKRTEGRLSGRGMADSGKILSAKGNKAKYWGLDQYMDTQEKTNFGEKVTPQFWAAPYIGILYPSTQVRESR